MKEDVITLRKIKVIKKLKKRKKMITKNLLEIILTILLDLNNLIFQSI